MRRIAAIMALAALAAGCSLVSDVDDLNFNGTDADSDSDGDSDSDIDIDTDVDTDADTDFYGTCGNPYYADTWPYTASLSTLGMPDYFFDLCQAACCAGMSETVTLFAPPYDGNFTVDVMPTNGLDAIQFGVMETCGDSIYCDAYGETYDSFAPATAGFYGTTMAMYYVVVQGVYDSGDYDIAIYDSAVYEDGTCEAPYMIGMLPFESGGDTSVQANIFESICGSGCCESGDAVYMFETPADGNYLVTLTNDAEPGAGAFGVSVLEACADGIECHADGSGAGNPGESFQVPFEAAEYTTYFIVVQGMGVGGPFSLIVEPAIGGKQGT